MEYTNEFASKGVAGAGLGLGIAGTALGLMGNNGNGILGGLFGNGRCGCNEDHTVNRYEAAQSARIASLETELKLRDANIYTDSKIADVYERLNGKIAGVEAQICQQAVLNATTNSTLGCLANQVAQLQALTKIVIPAANICPAPTTTTTAG